MSYLVMECHPGYVVLLDEEGRFLKAANLRYETGQTVYDPVLMKETPERQRHTVRWISSGVAAIAALLPAVLWHRLLPELSTALFIHISDHQPGSTDGAEPARYGCRADRGE